MSLRLACVWERTSSGLTPCGFRDEAEQVSVILGGGCLLVEALVHRRLIERREHGTQREMALGIASTAGHLVIVKQQTADFPPETP